MILIQDIFTSVPEQSNLTLLTCHDESAFDATHPLREKFISLKTAKFTAIPNVSITLPNFTEQEIVRMLTESFKRSGDVTIELGAWIYGKTSGNPLITGALIQELYRRGCIVLQEDFPNNKQAEEKKFHLKLMIWNIKKAEIETLVPDSLDFYASSSNNTLSTTTKQMLSIAACIGRTFNLSQVAEIAKLSEEDVAKELHIAMQYGIIVCQGLAHQIVCFQTSGDYKGMNSLIRTPIFAIFPHESVRAAWINVAKQLKIYETTYLNIAQSSAFFKHNEKTLIPLLDRVAAYNKARYLLIDHTKQNDKKDVEAVENECNQIVGWNIKVAMQMIQISQSHVSAKVFLNDALDLLVNLATEEDCWNRYYQHMVDIHCLLASIYAKLDDETSAELVCERLRENAKTVGDQFSVQAIRFNLLMDAMEPEKAIKFLTKDLRAFEVEFPDKNEAKAELFGELADLSPTKLLDTMRDWVTNPRPILVDETCVFLLDTYGHLRSAFLSSGKDDLCTLTCVRMFRKHCALGRFTPRFLDALTILGGR